MIKKYGAYFLWLLAICCLAIMDRIVFHGTPPQEYKGLFGDWWHALKQISLLMFALYGYVLKKINLLLHLVILALISWLTHEIVFNL